MMKSLKSRRNVLAGVAALAATFTSCSLFASEPMVHEVAIKSFKFAPKEIEARVGDIIRWTNNDLAPHTATAEEFEWDTQTLEKGEAAEIQVSEGMETTYFCAFHPHMKGKIKIVG